MRTVRGQNIILIIIIGVTTLTVLAALFFLKPPAGSALAQEGDNGETKATNQEATRNQNRNVVAATPVDASAEEEGIGPQSDGSGIEVVPIAAFRNNGDSGNGWFHDFNLGFIENQSSNLVCFMAPTYPPNGSTLTQFRFSVLDDSASSDLSVFLNRVGLATGQFELVIGGVLTNRDNSTPTEAFINIPSGVAGVSSAYAYYVDFCFPANSGMEMRLYGARLFYNP